MAEFAYKNTKNMSIGNIPFKLNHKYHLCISLNDDVYFHLGSHSAKELIKKLRDMMFIYYQNLPHVKKL